MAWQVTPLLEIRGTTDTTPQPAWGSWVASVATGNNFGVPASSPLVLTLGNACVSGNDAAQLFSQFIGQYAYLIDPGYPSTGNAEKVFIQSVSLNTLTLGPKPIRSASVSGMGTINPVTELGHVAGAIGTGSYILPAFDFNNGVITLEDGGTGAFLYIGNSMAMTTTSNRIWKLASTTTGSQPSFFSFGMFHPGNPFNMQEVWVVGTAGDKWSVNINVD